MADVPLLLPVHCRAARAMLDITQEQLAKMASVSRMTVRAFEAGDTVRPVVSNALRDALERAGVLILGSASVCDGSRIAYGVAVVQDPI